MSAPPRILIVGASGQVGTELQRSFRGFGAIVAATREMLDLSNEAQVRSAVREAAPDIILNAAAYTAVDRAEAEPDRAMAINAYGPRVLAEEARRRDALLVHYSTDYVFDGEKSAAWLETDMPRPLNAYGVSKRSGEEAIQEVGGRFLIFRTTWIYGPHGNNFLLTMLRLGRERDQLRIVDDQVGAPTTSIALADATRSILDGIVENRFGPAECWRGIYHMSCGGSASWCGFAREIFARSGPLLLGGTPQVLPISSREYPAPALRPANSVLSCEKLRTRFGIVLPEWQAALDPVLNRLRSRAVSH